ncbi:MAG TPA: hypothetical protein VFG04_21650, partial [Planctomycetaceae bacterium]|nr:hypothetical protein [Planctomycetaceae bacterium]
ATSGSMWSLSGDSTRPFSNLGRATPVSITLCVRLVQLVAIVNWPTRGSNFWARREVVEEKHAARRINRP